MNAQDAYEHFSTQTLLVWKNKNKTKQTNKSILCFHLQRVQENNSCLTIFDYCGFMEFTFMLPLGPKEIHGITECQSTGGKCQVCRHQPHTKTILPIHLKQPLPPLSLLLVTTYPRQTLTANKAPKQ